MTRVPAIGAGPKGRERVRRDVMVEQGVSPSAAVRKSLVVLRHEIKVMQCVGHGRWTRSLRTLFRVPVDFRDLGAVRDRLALLVDAGGFEGALALLGSGPCLRIRPRA